jgi:hypothetical protein
MRDSVRDANGLDMDAIWTDSHTQMAVAANVIPEQGSAPKPNWLQHPPVVRTAVISVVLGVAGWPARAPKTTVPLNSEWRKDDATRSFTRTPR